MLRTHTCGELRLTHAGQQATLCGWVQRKRDKGGMIWIDLRDRYGITQLIFEQNETDADILEKVHGLGREFVVQATGEVVERFSKNPEMATGDIEIKVTQLEVLNPAKTPPFTIEPDTDGGEELRMKYRYLDLRRGPVQENLIFRSRVALETRTYLSQHQFLEIETPFLIKSTPEGARDFVVPSRLNPGEFYALPQSPQTFKQLLMASGYDRYFQIVKCFRDEDLRADRQPEFTQIDCEMSFVEKEDILQTFEGLIKYLFREVKQLELPDFPRMLYDDAIALYGSDKPDLRFDMPFVELTPDAQHRGFKVFDSAELVVGICAPGCAEYSRKQLDGLTDFVKRPQVGAKGLVYVKVNADGSYKSSVDKFYQQEDLAAWARKAEAKPGDLLLILAGETDATRSAMSELRLKMGHDLGLIKPNEFKPVWILDFPLLEWDEETQRYYAMHHPFTAPKISDQTRMDNSDRQNLSSLRADAYDLVINGAEIGGGSIRIHDRRLQEKNLEILGFSPEEAREQFGFLMDAFEYGAPPHGGIAFGFDRLCAIMRNQVSIRDFIAFPKNNQGRDVMIHTPSGLEKQQLDDLHLNIKS